MTVKAMTQDEVNQRVGTTHLRSQVMFPPLGLQPYHAWLVEALERLSETGVGDFRVWPSVTSGTHVFVASGRASVGGVVLVGDGVDVDLAAHNNDTALVWLENQAGSAAVGVASQASGWPTGLHLKLAEVVLSQGEVVSVLDRRIECVLKVD